MKLKTTKKDVNNNFKNVICVGYCDLQNLLNYETPIAYTARREGWAADIYQFGNTAIVTGYAPFGNIRPDCKTCRKYEEKAEKLHYSFDYEVKKKRLQTLISEFIEEVTP